MEVGRHSYPDFASLTAFELWLSDAPAQRAAASARDAAVLALNPSIERWLWVGEYFLDDVSGAQAWEGRCRSLGPVLVVEQVTYTHRPVWPLTRVVGGALVPILALAAVGLYGWPGETERLFRGRSSRT